MNAINRWIVPAAALIALGAAGMRAVACGGYGNSRDAINVLSEQPDLAQKAMTRLRAAGPQGLEALLAAHRDMIDAAARGELASDDPQWLRLQAAVDAVGGQRTCLASRLFWHTDLDAAKAEAQRTGKPILSLRLLGKLTDELSCANSRFFRSTLYANAEVSDFLRTTCVLHWQSVRPVPVVTIDFGDGRTLRRTVTGNSIHYVLDSQGRVLDGLPGLYGPQAFLRELAEAVSLAADVHGLPEPDRDSRVRGYHDDQQRAVAGRLQADLEQLGVDPLTHAADAIDDPLWGRIAELHRADARLDGASIAVIRGQQPQLLIRGFAGVAIQDVLVRHPAIPAELAGAVAIGKGIVEDPILRVVRPFESSIALDTVRNEYKLHRAIHQWMADESVPLTTPVDQLNERVYAELFLTPRSDPWLGLTAGGAYTALDNGGIVSK